jgi:hypothetical protein
MELIVEDKEGRILGRRDLEGSRWEQVGDHFENVQDVAVMITKGGYFADMYIKNGNERIGSDTINMMTHALGPGFQVNMAAGKVALSFHEIRSQVWGDSAPGSQIQFACSTADDLKGKADELQTILARRNLDVPPIVAAAVEALLSTVYDLLASLKVT